VRWLTIRARAGFILCEIQAGKCQMTLPARSSSRHEKAVLARFVAFPAAPHRRRKTSKHKPRVGCSTFFHLLYLGLVLGSVSPPLCRPGSKGKAGDRCFAWQISPRRRADDRLPAPPCHPSFQNHSTKGFRNGVTFRWCHVSQIRSSLFFRRGGGRFVLEFGGG
jgi:hypothetical protein